MNEKDLVTFEQAEKLKELGFDWECLYHYDGYYLESNGCDYHSQNVESACISNNTVEWNPLKYIDAPFLYQVQNWLREEKNIHIHINTYYPNWQKGDHSVLEYECTIVNDIYNRALREDIGHFDSYHEALSAAVDYGLQKVVC